MAKQAADYHREAAEHHEKASTMPTSRMALTNRRSIMGLTRRSPMSNIMRIGSGAMNDGALAVNTLLAQTARQLGFFHSTIRKSAMPNPGFSNSMNVAEFRYIQAIHEKGELQNPDGLVGQFLPILRRWKCNWFRQRKLAVLRTDPFYYYLDARTRYYDKVFLDAITDNVQYIINVGCGFDTRASRFEHVLRQKGVQVLECDQPKAIQVKQGMAKRVGN